MEKVKKNVVLFPFMAQGHIIPFLALAQHIEQKGYTVTFINTPLNIQKLKRSLPQSSTINLVEIPFNSSEHGLPPGVENTDSLPYDRVVRLLEAAPCLQTPFKNLLSDLIQQQGGEKLVCIISDIFFGWCAGVAHEFGVYHAVFSLVGGFGLACYYSVWLSLPHKNQQSGDNGDEFTLHDFPEAGRFHVNQLASAALMASADDPFTNFQWKNLPLWDHSDVLLLNTVEEIDMLGIMYFQRKLGISVRGVGPLVLSGRVGERTARAELGISHERCIKWLNLKDPNSVLYISFGSQNTIAPTQMMTLAKSLISSGRNFVWVVRPPLGFDISSGFVVEQWLPEGFMQSMGNRGLVVDKWAPQVEILEHKAVSAFITHCGWNSVLESLRNAVPMMSWPMAAEQFYTAKFLVEEVGVGIEVARGADWELREEDVLEKIEMVMGENESARKMRRRACEVREIMRDAMRDEECYKGSSVKAIEEFFVEAESKFKCSTV